VQILGSVQLRVKLRIDQLVVSFAFMEEDAAKADERRERKVMARMVNCILALG
jgi:hypothetical protein